MISKVSSLFLLTSLILAAPPVPGGVPMAPVIPTIPANPAVPQGAMPGGALPAILQPTAGAMCMVPDAQKYDCGEPGIDKPACEEKGCCFDVNAPFVCFEAAAEPLVPAVPGQAGANLPGMPAAGGQAGVPVIPGVPPGIANPDGASGANTVEQPTQDPVIAAQPEPGAITESDAQSMKNMGLFIALLIGVSLV